MAFCSLKPLKLSRRLRLASVSKRASLASLLSAYSKSYTLINQFVYKRTNLCKLLKTRERECREFGGFSV
jgi:hypothetical protein